MQMKSLSEIAIGLITHIHDTLPEVDTKEGTFLRDVFINPVASQIADIYQEIKLVELAQSIVTATGSDLDRLARNFFITRKDAAFATGKLRFYIGANEPKEDIYVPSGAIVGFSGDANREPADYMTTAPINIIAGDPGSFERDALTGKWYVDVEAISVEPGSIYNIEANTITLLGEVATAELESVTNPFPFTGGSDAESDLSLQMRISMAITGVNIGTKDGYQSFIMKQNEVEDAIIVGAGEPLMTRDNGEGGMVDIYVRAEGAEEHSFEFDVDYAYVTDTSSGLSYKNIELPKQPVLMIEKIVGRKKNDPNYERTYINGSNYKKEKGTDKYYRDIKWDFIPIKTDDLKDDALLKAEADNMISDMLSIFNSQKDGTQDKLQDIKYDIDWQLINPYNDYSEPLNPNFYRGKYGDGLIYVITTKNVEDNPYVYGRNFISRDGVIHERIYVEPDFEIEFDSTPYSKSIEANDSIKWIPNSSNSNLPAEGETLHISYSWNGVMDTLQKRLDEKRILTADVLLKQATRIPVEVKLRVVPEIGYSPNTIRNSIINSITTYINDMKKLGGSIDRSDLVYIARGTAGVEAVDIAKVHLSIYDDALIQRLELKNYEYMQLENIHVEVLPVGTIV